jgi:signal transduction histidine kinase
MLELIVLCFSVVVNIALAVLVLAKNSQKNVNKYFAFFALSLVGWSVTNYISVNPFWMDQLFWIRLDMSWAICMSTALLLLVNVFPTGDSFYPKLAKIVAVPGLLLAVFAMSPWLFTGIEYSNGNPEPTPGPVMLPFALYTLTVLGFSVTILIRRFLHAIGKARQYILYALIGMAAMFILIVFFNFVMVVVFHNSTFIAFMPAFVLIFSVSFVYGMVRHQLFDIRLIVTRFIAYLLLLLFAGGIYGLITVVLTYFLIGIQPSLSQVILSAIVVGVLILFAQPLRSFFQRITRAIFYQDDYDTKSVLDELASVLVRSVSTDVVTRESLTILRDALKSQYITMMLVGGVDEKLVEAGDSKHRTSHIASRYLKDTPDILVADVFEVQPTNLSKKMREADISIIVRLETPNDVIGYCFFGHKTSGTAYDKRDLDLIRIARHEMAIAIQNTLRFDQIQKFNDTLQQRIEDATKKLRRTNEQLQKLDTAKDEFVSMASHQLRTPLTSVKGYISMVLEGDVGKITPTQRQMLSEAFTSSERMVHLIGDFLNVSRLQTGKFMLEKKPVDLAKLASQEIDSLQTTIKAHGLKLEYRKPSYFPVLMLDEGKVRQVLMNFIDNAIFYSQEGTTIKVKLSVEDGFAVVRVIDAGIGVPKSEQAHLFTKFFRASNARRQRPDGTGVGLFLAKKVISAHDGTMLFESEEGKGSTFGFRLPIKKLQASDSNESLDNGADQLKK